MTQMTPNDFIIHYGIKGMKWGIRRYQNEDGTLTPAGKKRKIELSDNQKKAARILGIIAASALVSYASYKFSTSPEVKSFIQKNIVEKHVTVDDVLDNPVISTIFSKKMNRYLSIDEAERLGLL